jgi:hypothetical protein
VVLGPDGLGVTQFGDDPETAVAALSGRYGTPEQDTGWVSAFDSPFGVCPGDTVRGVTWGQLTVLFTDGTTDYGAAGRQHLFGFGVRARGEDPVPEYGQGPQTAEGVGVGSTVADLRAAYPGMVEVVDEGPPFGPSFFIGSGGAGGGRLLGELTDTSDSGAVFSLQGGNGCGE